MGSSSDGVSAPEGVVSALEKVSSELPRRWHEEELGQSAYHRRAREMLELPKSKVTVVNLNLTEAIAAGLGVLPNVQMHRERLSKSVLDCRFDWVDGLEDYTLALNYARAEYLTVTRPRRCAPEVWLEARQVRRVLMQDWRALATRGLLSESPLGGLRRGKGYLELGTDLTVLSHVHRTYAASAGVALPGEAERASQLARLILAAGGRPDPKSEAVIKARDMQNRAFTVFVRAYNETRSSIAYMRRDEGDVDRIIPSLYAARRARVSREQRAQSAQGGPSRGSEPVTLGVATSGGVPSLNAGASPASNDAMRLGADTEQGPSSVQPFEDEPRASARPAHRKGFVN
jgi:hypothetical protein